MNDKRGVAGSDGEVRQLREVSAVGRDKHYGRIGVNDAFAHQQHRAVQHRAFDISGVAEAESHQIGGLPDNLKSRIAKVGGVGGADVAAGGVAPKPAPVVDIQRRARSRRRRGGGEGYADGGGDEFVGMRVVLRRGAVADDERKDMLARNIGDAGQLDSGESLLPGARRFGH